MQGNRPKPVIVAAAQMNEFAFGRAAADHVNRPFNALIKRNPVLPQMHGTGSEDFEGPRVRDRCADVGVRMLGQNDLIARPHVDADERRLVATERRAGEQTPTCPVDKQRVRAERVVKGNEAPRLRSTGFHSVDLLPALGRLVTASDPHAALPVEEKPGQAFGVLIDDLSLAGGQVERPNVMPAGIAVIEANQNPIGQVRRAQVDDG
ncbi:MAG TPA: hypothetical protein VJY34_14215 [Roseiarcus sp.]|nr:hypothetical protein [Roseiarcus sp.]